MRLEPRQAPRRAGPAPRARAAEAARRRRHRHGRAGGRRGGAAPPPGRGLEDRHARRGAGPGLQPRPAVQAARARLRARASSSCARCRGTPPTGSTCAAAAAPRRSTSTRRAVIDESGDRAIPTTRSSRDRLAARSSRRSPAPTCRTSTSFAPGATPTRSPPRRRARARSSSAAGCSASRRRPGCARAACASRSSSSPASSWASSSTRAPRRCSQRAPGGAGHRLPPRPQRGADRGRPRRARRRRASCRATRVVVAAGVRAETTLARAAGLDVERGIVVDDALRTSAPGGLGGRRVRRAPRRRLRPVGAARRAGARRRRRRRRRPGRVPRRGAGDDAQGLRASTSTPAACRPTPTPRGHDEIVLQRHAARDLPPARARRRAADRRRARRRRRPPRAG